MWGIKKATQRFGKRHAQKRPETRNLNTGLILHPRAHPASK